MDDARGRLYVASDICYLHIISKHEPLSGFCSVGLSDYRGLLVLNKDGTILASSYGNCVVKAVSTDGVIIAESGALENIQNQSGSLHSLTF